MEKLLARTPFRIATVVNEKLVLAQVEGERLFEVARGYDDEIERFLMKWHSLKDRLSGSPFVLEKSKISEGLVLVQRDDGKETEVLRGGIDDVAEFLESWYLLQGQFAAQGSVPLGQVRR